MLRYAKFIIPAAILLLVLCYLYVDQPFINWVTELPLGISRGCKILSGIISPNAHIIIWPLIFYLYTFVYRKSTFRKELLFLVLAIPLIILSIDILKVILGKARPGLWLNKEIYGFYFWGMSDKYHSSPSGHGGTIGGVMGVLSCFRPSFTWLFLTIALILSLLRVCSLDHYLSDAWGGVFIAFYIAHLLYIPYKKFIKRNLLWRTF